MYIKKHALLVLCFHACKTETLQWRRLSTHGYFQPYAAVFSFLIKKWAKAGSRNMMPSIFHKNIKVSSRPISA